MSVLNCRRLDFMISLHSLPKLLMEQTLLLQNMFGKNNFLQGSQAFCVKTNILSVQFLHIMHYIRNKQPEVLIFHYIWLKVTELLQYKIGGVSLCQQPLIGYDNVCEKEGKQDSI